VKQGAILDRALDLVSLDLALEVARTSDRSARLNLEFALRDRVVALEARKKTVRVLRRIWLTPPSQARTMIAWALDRSAQVADSRLLHIGALLATYPFFGDTCAVIGREVTLHGEVRFGAVRRYLRGRWGDRQTVDVSARAGIRTLRSLGALRGRPGTSTVATNGLLEAPEDIGPWLFHAVMLTRNVAEIDVSTVSSCPELFMFRMAPSRTRGYPFLEAVNEGGGRVVLRARGTSEAKPNSSGQLKLFVISR
jgi:hypothetical protein